MRMPLKLKQGWVAALRSGEYKQAQGRLMIYDAEGVCSYCCLGLMQKIADGKVETVHIGGEEVPGALPSYQWWKAHGVQGATEKLGYYGSTCDLTTSHLISMNDTLGKTFEEIADYVDKEVEGYEAADVSG